MSNFKIAVLTIFILCTLVGIALFALSKGNSSSTQSANLLVWGTLSEDAFNTAYKNSTLINNKDIKITYVKKNPGAFDADFVESLADGNGPDIIILREDSLYKERNKIYTIPYANFSERTFKDRFIEGSEIFLSKGGVVAMPFMVDPMVMYWNRDIFSNNSIAQTPAYWDEIYPLISKITHRDNSANILQSFIAFGEWSNIVNAKEIVSMLFLQAGTPITQRGDQDVVSVIASQLNYSIPPGQSALDFYTQFSNPTSVNYTWNRSLPTSLNMFLSGNLAAYIGFASEIFSIQQKNSNLNFDVTYIPQIRGATKKIVFGHMYALAMVKQSKQIPSAFIAINALTEAAALQSLETATNLPPVRRDLLANKPTDAFRTIFYNSALISHAWIDPDPIASGNTFKTMIQSITSGAARVNEALGKASDELTSELK
jgi:ABC-type glycerol-3-phosphate transport system substrate-binding protein